MSRKSTVITVLAICFAFTAFLAVRLLMLSSESGISVSVSSRASEEEIMTPGSTGYSQRKTPSPVELNSCSSEALQQLPGLGRVLADSVIAYRDEHGPFATPEDIMKVPGIGESIYEQIKDYIIIEE